MQYLLPVFFPLELSFFFIQMYSIRHQNISVQCTLWKSSEHSLYSFISKFLLQNALFPLIALKVMSINKMNKRSMWSTYKMQLVEFKCYIFNLSADTCIDNYFHNTYILTDADVIILHLTRNSKKLFDNCLKNTQISE